MVCLWRISYSNEQRCVLATETLWLTKLEGHFLSGLLQRMFAVVSQSEDERSLKPRI